MAASDALSGITLSLLGMKVLESLLDTVISGPVYEALKSPINHIEVRKKLLTAAVKAESEFTRKYKDKDICDVLLQLPVADLPSFQQGVRDFYNNHSDDHLILLLTQQLTTVSPRFSQKQIVSAVSSYLYFLQQELIIASDEFRKLSDSLNTLDINCNTTEIADDIHEIKKYLETQSNDRKPVGMLPPRPDLFVGRENDLIALKRRMGIGGNSRTFTIVRGWPGVGKTTLIARLAYDSDVARLFPDGVLWTALGQTPQLRGDLIAWGRALHRTEIKLAENAEEAANQLAAALRGKRMLLLVDDVWEPAHGRIFQIGGENCITLFSTRISNVASALATVPDDIYRLENLSDESALDLLRKLTPGVVRDYPEECVQLVKDLEGLPLSIQIAGRLLETDYSLGLPVMKRIKEIRSGNILSSPAPVDRMLGDGVTPTLTSLLRTSTDALDSFTRDCFTCLADFAPKPARFHLRTLARVWEVKDPSDIVKVLCGRGLLEPAGNGYFQMHAVLVWHAKELSRHR